MFTPSDWIELILSAKQTEPKFELIKMGEKNFYSVDHLVKFVDSTNIDWFDVKSIIYHRSEPSTLRLSFFSQRSDENINLLSKDDLITSQNTKVSSKAKNLISKSKFEDLQKVLKFLQFDRYSFFESIKYDDSLTDKDFALATFD